MGDEFQVVYSTLTNKESAGYFLNLVQDLVQIWESIMVFTVPLGYFLFCLGIWRFLDANRTGASPQDITQRRGQAYPLAIGGIIIGIFNTFVSRLHGSFTGNNEPTTPLEYLAQALGRADSSPLESMIYGAFTIINILGWLFMLKGLLTYTFSGTSTDRPSSLKQASYAVFGGYLLVEFASIVSALIHSAGAQSVTFGG